jgi:stage II sporulation protein D
MLKQPNPPQVSKNVVTSKIVKPGSRPVKGGKNQENELTESVFLPEDSIQSEVSEKSSEQQPLKQPLKQWFEKLSIPWTNKPESKPESEPGAKPESSKLAETLTGLSKRQIALAIGLLGASGGLAFTRVAPPSLQAAIMPQPANIPLRRSQDPAAEPVLETQDLFLTNEIFYRKIEAIAQVPRNQSATASKKGSPAQANSPAQTDAELKAAAAKAVAEQAEQVKAAAPPAPKAAAAPFTGTTIDSVLEMRVAVAKDVSAIAFATSSGGTLSDLNGNVIKSLPAETTALAEVSNGIVVDGQPVPNDFWVYPEEGGYVAVGSSWYRGRVRIALREEGLIAVNHVFLGDYLYSVVGSEMSADWAIESLKAQAIAARSYALTHNINPASEAYFDLDNTPRFQAYTGLAREASTTQLAVQSTAGEFISHEGGIVESLYAASQAIVDDAHSGSGMSQLGARDLADQGYSYGEILLHYYPGTALGRISTDAE